MGLHGLDWQLIRYPAVRASLRACLRGAGRIGLERVNYDRRDNLDAGF